MIIKNSKIINKFNKILLNKMKNKMINNNYLSNNCVCAPQDWS